MDMVLSPMQPNSEYITRKEFQDHDVYMRNGFEKVFEQIDNVEGTITARIDVLEVGVNKKFDSIDTRFDGIGKQLDTISSQVGLLTKITTKLVEKLG